MRKTIQIAGICAVAVLSTSACATKGFVRTEVGQVNDKVTTLGTSLEETQQRVGAAEARITEVDGKAASAAQAAQQARKTADTAMATGGQALEVGKQASARAEAVETSNRKLILEVVLSDDQAKFGFGAADLSPAAKAAIDQMLTQLTAQKSAVWVEIQGHTDSTGDAAYNERLGLERAEAVKRYLHDQHKLPLHKMNTISFGEAQPAAENRTRDGRSRNRRVVIRVLG